MCERAKAFEATFEGTIRCITFDITFAITKFSFCRALFKRIMALEQSISKR